MADCSRCGAPLDAGIVGTDRVRCGSCGTARPGPGGVLLMPDLREMSLSAWSLPPPETYEHRPASGELTLRCIPPAASRAAMYSAASFDDVELAVTLRIGPGVEAIAGIDLRKSGEGSYDFRLTGKGIFMASRYGLGEQRDWLVSPTAHPGLRMPMTGPNRLAVLAKGERIRVFLNGQLAASLRDATLRRGSIGLAVFCSEEPAAVAFSDFTLFEAE